jgi:hypothetical protein
VPLGENPEARVALVRERILRVFAPGKPVTQLSPRIETGPCFGEKVDPGRNR